MAIYVVVQDIREVNRWGTEMCKGKFITQNCGEVSRLGMAEF